VSACNRSTNNFSLGIGKDQNVGLWQYFGLSQYIRRNKTKHYLIDNNIGHGMAYVT
jgi:hypothetical protein